MSVAVMKALHSPIPLILDAYSASFPPNYHPPSPPSLRCNKQGFLYPTTLANTTRNKYVTLTHKLLTQLVYTYSLGHLFLGGHSSNLLTIYV